MSPIILWSDDESTLSLVVGTVEYKMTKTSFQRSIYNQTYYPEILNKTKWSHVRQCFSGAGFSNSKTEENVVYHLLCYKVVRQTKSHRKANSKVRFSVPTPYVESFYR